MGERGVARLEPAGGANQKLNMAYSGYHRAWAGGRTRTYGSQGRFLLFAVWRAEYYLGFARLCMHRWVISAAKGKGLNFLAFYFPSSFLKYSGWEGEFFKLDTSTCAPSGNFFSS